MRWRASLGASLRHKAGFQASGHKKSPDRGAGAEGDGGYPRTWPAASRSSSQDLLFHSAVHILDTMTGKKERKDPAAVSLGRKGGLRSRVNLTPEERTRLARRAARARWGKDNPKADAGR